MKNGYQQHFKKLKLNKETSKTSSSQPAYNKKPEMRVQKKKNKDLPMSAVIGGTLILLFAVGAYSEFDKIEAFLNKIEISVMGQASAETTEKKTPSKAEKAETSASAKSPEGKTTTTAPAAVTQEELSLFKSLEDRKKQLDQRESELKKLEAELHKQKEELEKRLAELEQLRSKIGNQLQERVTADAEKVDKLVSFYSNMKAQKAAKVFETMNEDLAVEILQKMKKKEAAEILNLIEAEKAKKLSEKFAGYRKN